MHDANVYTQSYFLPVCMHTVRWEIFEAYYFIHWPMEILSTTLTFVHEQVTDILKVRERLLRKYSYSIKFRALPTMCKNLRNLFRSNVSLYTIYSLAKQP